MACSLDPERLNSQIGQCWEQLLLALTFCLHPGKGSWKGCGGWWWYLWLVSLSLGNMPRSEGLPTNERRVAAWLHIGEQAASSAPHASPPMEKSLGSSLPSASLGWCSCLCQGLSPPIPRHHTLCPASGDGLLSGLLALSVQGWPRSLWVTHGASLCWNWPKDTLKKNKQKKRSKPVPTRTFLRPSCTSTLPCQKWPHQCWLLLMLMRKVVSTVCLYNPGQSPWLHTVAEIQDFYIGGALSF